MKTRRFKALENGRIIEKITIYDDNGKQTDCQVIRKQDGKEFYYISNPNDKNGLFIDRPKDAIECIRNGFGDAFRCGKLLGSKTSFVVKFIDEEYGKEMRQKTIDSWRDAKFAYAVKFTYLDSWSGGKEVCKNKCLFGWNNKAEDILTFESEEAANDFIKDVESRAKQYSKEYFNLPTTTYPLLTEANTFNPFLDRIEKEMEGGMWSVYWNVFSAINDGKNKNNKKLYNLEAIQIVLREE